MRDGSYAESPPAQRRGRRSVRRFSHADVARAAGIDADVAAGDPADGVAQQVVLDGPEGLPNGRGRRVARYLDRALRDYRPGVDPLVDEVDGDAENLDAVG